MQSQGFPVATAAMVAVLLITNFLFFLPITPWLNAAAFGYPVIYLVCDCANRLHGPALAGRVVWAGLLIGLPMSFLFVYLNMGGDTGLATRLAGASGLSFLVSQRLNIAVFDRLRHREWWQAPLASSALASAVDTPIFFLAGFAGSDLPWTVWMLGNLFGKAVMLFVLLLPYRVIIMQAERRQD